MIRVLKPGGFAFWWDLPYTAAPTDKNLALRPTDYFDWPLRNISLAKQPSPSEHLRPFRVLTRVLASFLDRVGYPATHDSGPDRTPALVG